MYILKDGEKGEVEALVETQAKKDGMKGEVEAKISFPKKEQKDGSKDSKKDSEHDSEDEKNYPESHPENTPLNVLTIFNNWIFVRVDDDEEPRNVYKKYKRELELNKKLFMKKNKSVFGKHFSLRAKLQEGTSVYLCKVDEDVESSSEEERESSSEEERVDPRIFLEEGAECGDEEPSKKRLRIE